MNDKNQNLQKGIISLIRSGIENKPAILPESFDWNEAMNIVESHGIAVIIYYGVHKSKIQLPKAVLNQLKQKLYESIIIDECQEDEISKLFREFSEHDIDYMPLKGCLLKKLYPKSEMRGMGDIDVLIRTEQYSIISEIMNRLGYIEDLESDHEFKWSKTPCMVVELHKRLIPSYNQDYYAYYGEGWGVAQRSPIERCCYVMSPEDEFIYIFTHFAKHYRDGGIGIRHLVDIRIFMGTHPKLNMDYMLEELEKLKLYNFYVKIIDTTNVWFDDANSSDITSLITEYIFESGSYGTYERGLLASAVKKSRPGATAAEYKRNRIKDMIFPTSSISKAYPMVKKIPILLPLFWALRAFKILLFRRDVIKEKKEEIRTTSYENVTQYRNDLNRVGLDFNFKE